MLIRFTGLMKKVVKRTIGEKLPIGCPNIRLKSATRLHLGYYGFPFMYASIKDVLARAYVKKGEFDKAIAEYERLITFDPNNKDQRNIHPKYHYRLAKLYEEKGWKSKAIKQYEKFLEIWKDADEDLLELIDAKARYAKLIREK